MFEIPQEEMDKLQNASFDDELGEDHEEAEEEAKEEEQVPIVEEKASAPAVEDDAVADKARVPYSRFETVNERAIRAEERLAILEEQLNSNKVTEEPVSIAPEEFVELYGDSEVAQRAWQLQAKLNDKMLEEATERALNRIEERQSVKQTEIEKNLESIEDSLASFQETLGRKLTEPEESALLDIQDEFTPKDEQGNYIAPLLAPEKAFEIYNLRSSSAKSEKIQARRKVASITGDSSDGGSSNSAFDDYRPGVGGLWRNKL